MRHRLILLLVVMGLATLRYATAEELSPSQNSQGVQTPLQPQPANAKHHAKKPQSVPLMQTGNGAGEVKFSDPTAPLTSERPAKQQRLPTEAPRQWIEPQGGVSFDMKWHATNSAPDPFDAVRHTSGPNGPGDAVEGGFKLGF